MIRTTRTLLKSGGEVMCFGRVGNSCSNKFTLIIIRKQFHIVAPSLMVYVPVHDLTLTLNINILDCDLFWLFPNYIFYKIISTKLISRVGNIRTFCKHRFILYKRLQCNYELLRHRCELVRILIDCLVFNANFSSISPIS
jgi:hypothetical protein